MEDDTMECASDTTIDSTNAENIDFNENLEEKNIDDLYDSINVDEDTNNDIEDFDFNSSDYTENCEVDELFEKEMGYNPTDEELEGFADATPDITLDEYKEQNEEYEKETSDIDTMLENKEMEDKHRAELNEMMDAYYATTDDDDENFQKVLKLKR